MKYFILTILFFLTGLSVNAQSKFGTVSQAYGSGSRGIAYTLALRTSGTNYITQYKFGNFTVTATNRKSEKIVHINIKTPGILGANTNTSIPYNDCDGFVLFKGGASNLLGSHKLEYLISFRSTAKTYVSINQVMDDETDRYHYSLEKLNDQLYAQSKKIWANCKVRNVNSSSSSVTTVKTIATNGIKLSIPSTPSDVTGADTKGIGSRYIASNATQNGIITKIYKDDEGEDWINICYKDRLGDTPYKGYILADVKTSDYFTSEFDDISKTQEASLKKILLVGRKIQFQTEILGTFPISYRTLTYIKALPSTSFHFEKVVLIEKEL